MPRSPRRSSPIAQAVFVIALAALLLIEGIASTVHSTAVRHTVCVEHGETLDVAHRPELGHAHAAGTSSDCGPSVEAGALHGTAHDACAFTLLDSPRRLEFHGELFLLGRAPQAVVAACQEQPAGRLTVARIRFAPKHSPPA
ncbi:MAG: hypothetical protein ACKVXR_13345 [Planctomycetota bacterium]